MTKRPKLRSVANGNRICQFLAEGFSLRQIGRELGCDASAIAHWVREDQDAGGAFSQQYARAREIGFGMMSEEIIAISDANYTGPDGFVDNGAVQQAKLRSDNRKWYLSKMLPKRYGDRITTEITGEDGGALITKIELVPVAARPRPEADAEVASAGEAAATPLRAITSR
jgi:hypothetical protein